MTDLNAETLSKKLGELNGVIRRFNAFRQEMVKKVREVAIGLAEIPGVVPEDLDETDLVKKHIQNLEAEIKRLEEIEDE